MYPARIRSGNYKQEIKLKETLEFRFFLVDSGEVVVRPGREGGTLWLRIKKKLYNEEACGCVAE